MIKFIIGGARSGKSAYAESVASASGRELIYIATAAAGDSEMSERIKKHKERRRGNWQTIEEEIDISAIIQQPAPNNQKLILIDCLTLWLSNLLHYKLDVEAETEKLLSALKTTKSDIILVSNEVGQGIIPDNALARKFVDEAGILHQKIAKIAHEVFFVTAGIPNKIKG
jgi:adenosylcobinamide kinase/adenosylcobinamide-phosphate guanylyltransferase